MKYKKTTIKDDRETNYEKALPNLVIGQDTFLSGWGDVGYGLAYCAWACSDEHLDTVKTWVKSRSDMKGVRIVDNKYVPQDATHYHIYVVGDNHSSLKRKE